MSLSFLDAASFLSAGTSIHVSNSQNLIKNSLKENLYQFFKPQKKTDAVIKVIELVKSQMQSLKTHEKELLSLGDAILKRYKDVKKLSSVLQSLDHTLAISRKKFEHSNLFQINKNQDLMKKWVSYGFDETIFINHPEFAQFLMNSTLASQIKITRDTVHQVNGMPAILVEGCLTGYDDLVQRFEYKYVKEFQEILIHEKETGNVYTYLDNGRGLELFHPYKEGLNKPIGKISHEQYLQTLELSQKFVRTTDEKEANPNKERTYIFQIVTSEVKTDTTGVMGNYRKTFTQPRHSYIRAITPNGDVYEIGYGIQKKAPGNLVTSKGVFRSIDRWEYMAVKSRYVTNIAMTKEEFEKAQDYVNTYNTNEKPAFNFICQNCAVFTKQIVKFSLNIHLPTKMTIIKVIQLICPEFLKVLGRALKNVVATIMKPVKRILPQCVNNSITWIGKGIEKVGRVSIAFFFGLIHLLCGGIRGNKGRKFTHQHVLEYIKPPLRNIRNWFRLKAYNIHFNGPIQEWQKKQLSTMRYKKPIKLSVAASNN